MKVHIKNSTVVRPAQETPKHRLRCSELDLTLGTFYSALVNFYKRPIDSCNFFEAGLLKETLSKVLVSFYATAGRLARDENGRIEINCNGEGVVFMEAETSCTIDDLGDFEATAELMKLVPTVDSAGDLSSFPLLLIQVTHFKCGGVCFGILSNHILADGASTYYFLNSWGEIARGLPISILPIFDRSYIESGVPDSPLFQHLEYSPYPSMNTPSQKLGSVSTSILKLSPEQINILKEKSKKDNEYSNSNYSRLAIISAHIWRCACKARGLSNDQATKIHFPTNGRSKLNLSNPTSYVGNALFSCAPMALSGDILSEPFSHTVERIHNAVKRMDEKYLKSTLAYLKQHPDILSLKRGGYTFACPNLTISKVEGMPAYGADFGWGSPVFGRLVNTTAWDGMVYILPSPANDGSLLVTVDLETNHLQLFKKFFYDIFSSVPNVISKY